MLWLAIVFNAKHGIICVSLGTLSSIPTALTRWTDECKVLDAESMHDCVAGRLAQKLISYIIIDIDI